MTRATQVLREVRLWEEVGHAKLHPLLQRPLAAEAAAKEMHLGIVCHWEKFADEAFLQAVNHSSIAHAPVRTTTGNPQAKLRVDVLHELEYEEESKALEAQES